MPLVDHALPPHPSTSKITNFTSRNPTPKPIHFTNLLSLALTVILNSPFSSLGIASLNSQPPLLFPTTHFLNPRTCRLDYKMGILMKLHFFFFLYLPYFMGLNVYGLYVFFVLTSCNDLFLQENQALPIYKPRLCFNKSAIFIICIPMEDSRECNPGFKEFSALWLNEPLQCNLYLLWLLILCRSCRKQCRKMPRFESLKMPQMAIDTV